MSETQPEIFAWITEHYPEADKFNRIFASQVITRYQETPLKLEMISRGSDQSYWGIVRGWLEAHV